jgi:hypothetical protein
VPREPRWFARAHGGTAAGIGALAMAPLTTVMKHRIRAAGLLHNDHVFGIASSGAMDEATMLEILGRLPSGITEIYLHPAAASGTNIAASMASYRHSDELAALLSPRVNATVRAAGVKLGGYSDVLAHNPIAPVAYSGR